MPSSPHIYVNQRQIKYGQYQTNKESGKREWKLFEHSILKGKDGEPLKMARVMLPDLEKRQKVHGDEAKAFGTIIDEKSGIEINRDERSAYIQVPVVELKAITNTKGEKTNLRALYFNNQQATFNVYFGAKKYEVNRGNELWNKFDNAGKEKVGVDVLQKIFPTTREEVKRLSSQIVRPAKEQQKAQEKTQAKAKTTERKTPKKNKDYGAR